MRRAADLVRAGNPVAATEIIQNTLGAKGVQTPPRPSAAFSMPFTGQPANRRGLSATLADLAKKMPKNSATGANVKKPSIPEGAKFESGTFSCAAGARDYHIYIPNLKSKPPAGLIMMLHGCTQSPVDFANGTDMNRVADAHGLIIVYPAQSRGANMQSCWNWFGPADQNRGSGEPAILASMAGQICDDHAVPDGKVYVAGLSAGAAMAVILGQTYGDVFSGVGAHSGLPYKSANDVASAFATMGGGVSGPASATDAPVPTIVFHGTTDSTVNPRNGQRIADDARAKGTEVIDNGTLNGRKFTRTTVVSTKGCSVMENWQIDGLGHAWSGGNTAGSYTDAAGPDASAEMARFFLNISPKDA